MHFGASATLINAAKDYLNPYIHCESGRITLHAHPVFTQQEEVFIYRENLERKTAKPRA